MPEICSFCNKKIPALCNDTARGNVFEPHPYPPSPHGAGGVGVVGAGVGAGVVEAGVAADESS